MRHVDEGTMNAYLDGELDAQGAGSGERGAETVGEVETHLASCAECRALLDEVRRVRDRAREILAESTPVDLAAPSFDEIRARAEARSGASRVLQLARIKRLAWAATVILAVAVGWYGREILFPAADRVGSPLAATESELQEAGSGNQEAEMGQQKAGSGERIARAREQAAERRIPEAEEGGAPMVAAESDRAVAASDTDEAGRGAIVETGVSAATPPAEVVAAAPSQAKAEPNAQLQADELANLADARKGRVDTVSQLAAEAPRPITQLVAGQPSVRVGGIEPGELSLYEDSLWVHASEAEVRQALGGDVPIVQDLPVVDYWISGSQWSNAVRVRQRLDDANLLELIVSRPIDNARVAALAARHIAAPVSAEERQSAAAQGFEEVTVRSGDYRVLLRAAVSADSLRALGEKIK